MVHNLMPALQGKKKKKKREGAGGGKAHVYKDKFLPDLIFCFHFSLQKAYVLSYFCQALFLKL